MTEESGACASARLQASSAASEPQRTCIGCRTVGSRSEMVRLVLQGSSSSDGGSADPPQLMIDAERTAPGRGAWIHDVRSCFESAIRKRAGHRAMRQPVGYENLSERLERFP